MWLWYIKLWKCVNQPHYLLRRTCLFVWHYRSTPRDLWLHLADKKSIESHRADFPLLAMVIREAPETFVDVIAKPAPSTTREQVEMVGMPNAQMGEEEYGAWALMGFSS